MTPQDRKDLDRIRDNLVRGVPIPQADALWLLDMVELLAWRVKSTEPPKAAWPTREYP
jgi:hypothetical protein